MAILLLAGSAGSLVNFYIVKQLFPYHTIEEVQRGGGRSYFHDFDHDGKSEQVFIHRERESTFYVDVNHSQQFNAFGSFPMRSLPAFGDYDDNAIDEIYFASYHNDSVFLHGYEYNKENEPVIKNYFIDIVQRYNRDEDFFLGLDADHDFTGDDIKDILVIINAAYNYHPRKLYVIDPLKKHKIESPASGAWKQQYTVANLDEDPMPEIVTYGYAPGNTPLDYPYHDHWSWVMMFDHDLSYLQEPIPYTERPGAVGPWEITQDTIAFFFGNATDFRTSLVRLSFDAKPYDTLPLLSGRGFHYLHIDNLRYLYQVSEGILHPLSRTFTPAEMVQVLPGYDFHRSADLNLDGLKEHIFIQQKGFVIYNSNFEHPFRIDFPPGVKISSEFTELTVKKHDPIQFAVSFFDQHVLYQYSLNPSYPIRWAAFLCVFGGLFLLAWFVLRFMELRRQSLDYQLLLMQVNSLKNQLDPHFTFNLLGSIRTVLIGGDKATALATFDKFSALLRSSLIDADRIEARLDAELESVKNYLELQRFRFAESFQFQVVKEDAVPDDLLIPKLLLQTHAENAVKHGVRPLAEGGVIMVRASKLANSTEIIISDNGVGRKNARKFGTAGTGKGLKMTQRLIQLFNQLFDTGIYQEVSNNPLLEGKNTGTRVRIIVPDK